MKFEQIKQRDQNYIANTYKRVEIDVASGQGSTCSSSQGKEYIDFSSGIGVNALGFASKKWVHAITEQAKKVAHISNLYYTSPQGELAEALCQRTGMKKVFYANSGAEANEGAIKTARKYSSDKYSHERYEIITLKNSFHGRTIATLAATGQDVFHQNFGPFPEGFVYAEANNLEDVKSLVTAKTCAVFMELIQGEGGVIPLTQEFVTGVAELCQEQDLLLMIDEVQTGIGRTGTFLCTQQYGIQPDVITLAKGLGGGLPLGAVLFGAKTEYTLGAGDHATTFGGNPIATAGALVVLEEINDVLLKQVAEKGAYLTKKLLSLPQITGVTGSGLMLGATLAEGLTSGEVVAQCGKEGLILLTAKEKLRFLPPLTITYEELDKGLAILTQVLEKE